MSAALPCKNETFISILIKLSVLCPLLEVEVVTVGHNPEVVNDLSVLKGAMFASYVPQ